MVRIIAMLLVVLALLEYTGSIASSAVASTAMKCTGENESAGMPEFSPDLDPGSPFGWPQGLDGPSPSHHRYRRQDTNCDADAHGKGSDRPDKGSMRD